MIGFSELTLNGAVSHKTVGVSSRDYLPTFCCYLRASGQWKTTALLSVGRRNSIPDHFKRLSPRRFGLALAKEARLLGPIQFE